MARIRFMCSGRINKPLPDALVIALPAIKTNLTDLQTYAQKINIGTIREEATDLVIWGNEPAYIWFQVDLAFPMPLAAILKTKLPAFRDKIRQLKTYTINTREGAFIAKYHICHHDEGINHPVCEVGQDI